MQDIVKAFRKYFFYTILLLLEALIIGAVFRNAIIAIAFGSIMLLYMDVLGETYGRFSMRCRLIEESEEVQKHRAIEAFERVKKKAEIQCPFANRVKLYYIPTDNINAYSFGRKSIGITKGAMRLDSKTMEAIISHEFGHSINADMFFYRFLFGNLIGAMVLIGIWNLFFIGFIAFIGVIIFAFTALRLNFVTYQLSNIFLKFIQKVMDGVQNVVIAIGEAIIALVSRRSEYNADFFAYKLGYGKYLCLFLSKYVKDLEMQKPRTITEAIYASHPDTINRINYLKSLEE